MKISKKRIIEIIKEEIERDLAGSESDLQVKLRDLSTAIRDEDVKIEPAEAEQVDAMITRILTVASMDNVSTADLKKANDSIQKYLNVDSLTEDQLDEASALVEVRSSAEDSDVIETLDNYLQNKKKLYSVVKTFLNSIEKKASPEELQAMAYQLDPSQFALNETEDEWTQQFDQIKTFITKGNLNEACRLVYGELEKRIKLITDKWKESNQVNHKDVSGLYEDMNIWLKAYETGVSIVQLHLDQMEKEPEQPSDGSNDAKEKLQTAIDKLNQAQDFETFKEEYVAALTAAQELSPEKYTNVFIEKLILNINSVYNDISYNDLSPTQAEELSGFIRSRISGFSQPEDQNKLTAHHKKFIELLKNKEADTGTEEQPAEPEITQEMLKDLVVKFADMLKSNNLLSEGIGDIVKILDIKDTKKFGALLGKTFTRDEIRMIDGIFQSKLKDKFVNLVRNAAKQEPQKEPSQPEEDQPQAEELPSGDKAIVAALPELQDAFAKFSNDDSGFMKVGYLKDQDEMIGALRSALRKFIGLEGLESALTEQEEQTPEAPPPEDKTKGARQKLVKDVGRYRRDLNDTGNILGQYLKAAKAGRFKAQPILNKLKVELQKVQDNNVVIVRDLKSVAGLKENLLTEEETRDEKIANVRRAYEAIVGLLRPTLQIRTIEPTETTTTTPMQSSEEGEAVEEVMLEDIFLEQTGPTEEELQSLVDAVKQSLEQIDSIKKYFRVTGTFNRPLDELQTDFLEYVNSYKKTMSDLVADLRQGVPSPENATQYAQDFARLAEQIKEDFGVSPSEPIKVAGVPAVQPEGTPDETAAVNDSPQAAEAEQTTVEPEVSAEPEEADVSPQEIERAKIDVVKFLNDSNKFITNFTTPLIKIFKNQESSDEDKVGEINKLKTTMAKKRMLQEEAEDIGTIVQKAYNAEATIKDVFRNIPTTEFVQQKMNIIKVIKGYLEYRQKFDRLRTIDQVDFDDWNNDIDTEIEKMAAIAGKVVRDSIDDPEIKNGLLRQLQDPEDVPEATAIKQQRAASNIERTRKLGSNAKIRRSTERGSDPTEYGKDPTRYMEESKENLLERLIKEQLKVLNGKKMVCN